MNKKTILFIVFLVVGYFCLLFVFTSLNKKTYILIDNNTKWKISNKKWENIEVLSKINGKDFNLFYNSINAGQYKSAIRKNKLVFLNNKNEIIERDGELFAFSGNTDVSRSNLKTQNLEESDIIELKETLKTINILGYKTLKTNYKMKVDINNDKIEDKIVVAMNNNFESDEETEYFSIVYVVINEKVKILAYDIQEPENLLGMRMYLAYDYIAINKNSYMILNQGTFGEHIPDCHYVFDPNIKNSMIITSCMNEVK